VIFHLTEKEWVSTDPYILNLLIMKRHVAKDTGILYGEYK
jgi:hypothetical protein